MGDFMLYKIGDLVTRKSYNHDMVFKIINIRDEIYELKGEYIRLYADSFEDDLELYKGEKDEEEREFSKKITTDINLERDEYFYLPGKILHIDGDEEYLNKCLDYYKKFNLWAVGAKLKESEIPSNIRNLLEKYHPNIVVITGHDAFYKRKGNQDDLESYKNSKYFVESIREARKYEDSHEKLIIIAGACQSDYDELIRAGANFASSPKRVNIHALDPAIVAKSISLVEITKDIDVKQVLEKTKYGKDGIGGIKTKGTMYVGFPR